MFIKINIGQRFSNQHSLRPCDLGPFGSAVVTFNGYKQTERRTKSIL